MHILTRGTDCCWSSHMQDGSDVTQPAETSVKSLAFPPKPHGERHLLASPSCMRLALP